MQTLKNIGSIHIDEKTLCDIKTRELVVSIDFGVFGYDGAAKSVFIVVFQNITETALLEKNRREFIANVSHELRTPLTSVKGATETVRRALDFSIVRGGCRQSTALQSMGA